MFQGEDLGLLGRETVLGERFLTFCEVVVPSFSVVKWFQRY
jgi:hypothetical protein